MDYYHNRFPVYDDVSSPENHFVSYAKIPTEDQALEINGSWPVNPHGGATSIRFELAASSLANFGGFYFLNGILLSGETTPKANFGTVRDAGVDLSGAVTLSFWARGERGNEVVDFFMGGVGRDSQTGAVNSPCTPEFAAPCPAPDSTPVIKLRNVALSTSWQKYTIPLTGANLSYVLGGFGWVASIRGDSPGHNNPNGVVLYIDDVEYELSPEAKARRLAKPRFLRSYTTLPIQPNPNDANLADDFDLALRSLAFSYDNALAILAFLADESNPDSIRRAKLVGDAFVYVVNHDRTWDPNEALGERGILRVRSAYAAGGTSIPPGWTPNGRIGTAPAAGFWNEETQKFLEVEQQALDTGNNTWVVVALANLYKRTQDRVYLDTAIKIANFIGTFQQTSGTYQGFTGGIENPESSAPRLRTYASSEHNLDIYAAFTSLWLVTQDQRWKTSADHARKFVESMWDPSQNCYLTGTTNPEIRNAQKGQLPLDVQAWAALSTLDSTLQHPAGLNCAATNHEVSKDSFRGFDFNEDKDGIWFEGTAQMAVAYAFAGVQDEADVFRSQLQRAQSMSGFGNGEGLPAASHDQLSTGFGFVYYKRLHVGATAWNVFAQLAYNPYYASFIPNVVSGTTFQAPPLATDSFATAFGSFATDQSVAAGPPLPSSLGGLTVAWNDGSRNVAAGLYYASHGQLNFVVPQLATSSAVLKVLSAFGDLSAVVVPLTPVSPSLSATSDGSALGNAVRVRPDGSRTTQLLVIEQSGMLVPLPIDLGEPQDRVIVSLYGTGFRQRTSLAAVSLTLGGTPAVVSYAGAQGFYPGLDQLNVEVPRSLAGRNSIEIVMRVDGKSANVTRVTIK